MNRKKGRACSGAWWSSVGRVGLRARGARRATAREKVRFRAGNGGLFFGLRWRGVARGGRAERTGRETVPVFPSRFHCLIVQEKTEHRVNPDSTRRAVPWFERWLKEMGWVPRVTVLRDPRASRAGKRLMTPFLTPVRRAQRRVFYRALMTPFLLLPDSTWQLRSNRSLVAPEPHLQRG